MKYFKSIFRLASGMRPLIDSWVDDSLAELLRKGWSQSPSDRPTIEEFVKFFGNQDPEKIKARENKADRSVKYYVSNGGRDVKSRNTIPTEEDEELLELLVDCYIKP